MSKSTITFDGSTLVFHTPQGVPEFTFPLDDIHDSLREAVFAYGVKQILADAGAVGRSVPSEERLNRMEKRARGLRDGSWAFRDGFGTPKADANYLIQFDCLAEASIIPGDDASRAAWKAMKPADRRAVWESDLASPARTIYAARAASRPAARAKDVSALLARLGVAHA